mmetsp:Transcript_5252/g.12313  ORF Transcript_5252/g.12313 Transcript_5252/m.12313 type:complete len:253 (+) Transcript_5252:238-996(+)
MSSCMESSSSAFSSLHPALFTSRLWITTFAPGAARTTRAPSSSRVPWIETSPSSTSALLPVTLALESGEIFSLISSREVPKDGRSTTRGGKSIGMSANVPDVPSISTSTPARERRRQFNIIASRSADPAHSGGNPLRAFVAASVKLFFTGEKQSHRSISVKPTFDSGGRRRGKSCIMHSSRVGLLKEVFELSAYLGLTNSLTLPPVASRTFLYCAMPKTKQLILPGNGEWPVAGSATSPVAKSLVDRRRGSS